MLIWSSCLVFSTETVTLVKATGETCGDESVWEVDGNPLQAAAEEGKTICKCADARKKEAAHGRMNIRMQMSQGWFRRCILQQLRAPPLNQLSWVISVITNLSRARKEPKVYMGLKTSYTSISLKSNKRFLRARQVMTDHYHPYCLSLGCNGQQLVPPTIHELHWAGCEQIAKFYSCSVSGEDILR